MLKTHGDVETAYEVPNEAVSFPDVPGEFCCDVYETSPLSSNNKDEVISIIVQLALSFAFFFLSLLPTQAKTTLSMTYEHGLFSSFRNKYSMQSFL